MFLIYPIGHDQEAYSAPWITWLLTAACIGVFLWMNQVQPQRELVLANAALHFEQIQQRYPRERISEDLVRAAPALLAPHLQHVAAAEPTAGEALETATVELITAARALPVLRLGYVPAEARLDRAFSSMFAHGGWMHLIGNLLLLVLAGSILEGFWRLPAFLALYFGAGAAAIVAHHMVDPQSPLALVGASGAIAGLIAALLIGFARTRFTMGWLLFLGVIKTGTFQMPVWVAAPVWGALQIWSLARGDQDGVAYAAHVGGFIFGLLFALLADRLHWIARDAGHI